MEKSLKFTEPAAVKESLFFYFKFYFFPP